MTPTAVKPAPTPAAAWPNPTPAAPKPPPAPLRVAVADDDRDVRDFLEKFLPRLGYAVNSVAKTGKELVEQCRANRPDLIIADLKMPEMSGLDAIEAVNADGPVPAVLLTGHTDAASVERAEHVGVMAYLVKPVAEDALGPALALARRQFDVIQSLRAESADLRRSLEDRKLVERAKGAVVRRVGLSEDEAYRRLRRMATDSNRKLIDVAKQVMAAEDAFREVERLG